MNKEVLLGVDPGRSKTGLALVTEAGDIKKYAVVLMEDFTTALQNFIMEENIKNIILGNGTTSETMKRTLKEVFPLATIHIIEESHSTEEARRLYWRLNPPSGWRKLLPLGLQVPPDSLDGLAAIILTKRFLKLNK